MFGKEPAAIIALIVAVAQSVGILWMADWRFTEVDPELWLMPIVTALGGLATRQEVMPVKTINEAGLTTNTIKIRAKDPNIASVKDT